MHDVLIDEDGVELADIEFDAFELGYHGYLHNMKFPHQMRELFYEFEACVNSQLFVAADQLDKKIEVLGLSLRDAQRKFDDFQLMNGNQVFFKVETPIE